MDRARARERAAERMVVSLAEAAVLVGCTGKVVQGVVVDVDQGRGIATVQLVRPAVVADIALTEKPLTLGDEVHLRVVAANPEQRTVQLEPL